MKLSIVIICWNDLKVILACLKSIFEVRRPFEVEVIVSDNGSTDGSVDAVRRNYPQVRVIENRANLGYARANNRGIKGATGEYVLILNPDTIIHEGAIGAWLEFADRHPEAGGFGCRVLNKDGSYQAPARPFPSVSRYWMAALCLRWLGRVNDRYAPTYGDWDGKTDRPIDWQSGCCVLFRGELLKRLGGFDERFFYHYEEVDLCRRVWDAGYTMEHCSAATVTHLGGQSVGRFPIRFELETYRNRYRYFHKHFGRAGLARCKRVSIAALLIRKLGYGLLAAIKPSDALRKRLEMYQVVLWWNSRLDPERFIELGEEPDVGYEALAPATPMAPSVQPV
jgi:GT2 family glycosyltransferase